MGIIKNEKGGTTMKSSHCYAKGGHVKGAVTKHHQLATTGHAEGMKHGGHVEHHTHHHEDTHHHHHYKHGGHVKHHGG